MKQNILVFSSARNLQTSDFILQPSYFILQPYPNRPPPVVIDHASILDRRDFAPLVEADSALPAWKAHRRSRAGARPDGHQARFERKPARPLAQSPRSQPKVPGANSSLPVRRGALSSPGV